VGPAVVTAVLGVLPILIALFFRDPDRTPSADPASVLSPADGKIMHAGMARPDEAPPGRWRQITIFLSPLDVHINRTPVAGRVTKVVHVPGTFLPAFRHESHRNEHSEIWINHDGVEVVARQVVGAMARRVVCRVQPGDVLGPGERIGLMKFGSRMDVFMPETAEVLVKQGDQVRGGETVIARLGGVRS
jgi:phosphatidylserine decarboxylase